MPEKLYFEPQALGSLNTFGIAIKAQQFAALTDPEQLVVARETLGETAPFFLGGGSNILFTRDPEEPLLGIRWKGIEASVEGDEVLVHVAAGENWHHFTQYCVERAWGGVENLSLIPGQVGTAPVQNIGAYGVELKDVLTYVDVFDWLSGQFTRLDNADCALGYRDSIFKGKDKGRYVITAVGMRLSKRSSLHTHYGAIQQELERMGKLENPSYADVAQAVIAIRKSKLPDPAFIGNAGSFFKNPVVDVELAKALLEEHPDAPHYPAGNNQVKLAAGWLIEKAGWKGHRRVNHGVHEKQALVLVNYGGATGSQILQLAEDIQDSILQQFSIALEMEVNIYR